MMFFLPRVVCFCRRNLEANQRLTPAPQPGFNAEKTFQSGSNFINWGKKMELGNHRVVRVAASGIMTTLLLLPKWATEKNNR